MLRDVIESVTNKKLRLVYDRSELPDPPDPTAVKIALNQAVTLSKLRQIVRTAARHINLPDIRINDLVTAVNEVGMNAIVHGSGGNAFVSIPTPDSVQVRVEDFGKGIAIGDIPREALSRGFTTAGSFGHGLKIMLECIDSAWLMSGPEGTTVVLEQCRVEPKPDWF